MTVHSLRPAILALIFGGLALSIMLGLRQAMGVLLAPVAQDTGWSIAGLGFGFALMNLMWGASQPVAGALADKHGPIPLMIGAAVLAALGLVLMNLTEALLFELHGHYDWVWWISIALGVAAALVHLPIKEQLSAQLRPQLAS